MNKICHRDLKPENFMFATPDSDSLVKLIDFGLSRSFYEFADSGQGKVLRMATRAGTSFYMAPEVFLGNYSQKCDYWSLGVLLFVMLGGYPPFDGESEQEIQQAVMEGEFNFDDEAWYTVSGDAKDLIENLLCPEQERFESKQVIKHPWIRDNVEKPKPIDIGSLPVKGLRTHMFKSKLKKAVVAFIASRSDTEDIREEIALFNQLDKNKDGYITKKEMQKGLGGMLAEEEISGIMDSVDTDMNGAINFNEFIAATIGGKIISDSRKIEQAFLVFDRDGNGRITVEELRSVLVGEDNQFLDEELFFKMIEEVDVDKDGEIDFTEFTRAITQ